VAVGRLAGGFLPSVIDPFPQHSRTLEGDHFARGKHDGGAGLGIATPPLILLFDAEFAETTDEDILSLLERSA